MNLLNEISLAYPLMPLPDRIVESIRSHDGDNFDARSFEGILWNQISIEHWRKNHSAIFAFSPCAFIYYLPSLLIYSLDSTSNLHSFECVVDMLDTSGNVDLWDGFFLDRFGSLDFAQCSALKSCVEFAFNSKDWYDALTMERVGFTLLLLVDRAQYPAVK